MNIFWKNISEKLSKKVIELKRKITNVRSRRSTSTKTIDATYQSTDDDFYIGVVSDKQVTVYLPENPKDGKIIIVKAEMVPPLSNRKITISTTDGNKIDGYSEATITVSHGCICVMFNNNGWHII